MKQKILNATLAIALIIQTSSPAFNSILANDTLDTISQSSNQKVEISRDFNNDEKISHTKHENILINNEVKYQFIKTDLYIDKNHPEDFVFPIENYTYYDYEDTLYYDYKTLDLEAAYFLKVEGQNENDDPLHVGSEQKIKANLKYSYDYPYTYTTQILLDDKQNVNDLEIGAWYDLMIPNQDHSIIYMFSINISQIDYCKGIDDSNLDCIIKFEEYYSLFPDLIYSNVDTNQDRMISKREALETRWVSLRYLGSELAYFPNIESVEFRFRDFGDSDILFLESLKNLKELEFSYVDNLDLSKVAQFSNIQKLTFNDSIDNDDLFQLKLFSNLKSLTLKGNYLRSLLPLAILLKEGTLKLDELNISEEGWLVNKETLGAIHVEDYDIKVGDKVYEVYCRPYDFKIIRDSQPRIIVEEILTDSDFFTKIVDPTGKIVSSSNNTFELSDYGTFTYTVYNKYGSKYKINIEYLPSIEIEDKYLLEQLIYNGVDKNHDGGISQEEALSTSKLTISDYYYQLTSLKGLEHFKNLNYLYVQYHNISNFSVIGELTKLETLWLLDTSINDVSFLKNLKNLIDLRIEGEITSLNVISDLSNLNTLYLWGNPLETLSGIEKLSNLETLELGGRQNLINDYTSLKGLTKLKNLTISYANLDNVDFVLPLKNLEKLNLSGNKIVNASFLDELNMPNLKDLDLQDNQIKDLSPVIKFYEKADNCRIDTRYNPTYNRNTLNAIHLPKYDYIITNDEVWIKPITHEIKTVNNQYQINLNIDNSLIDFQKIKLPNGELIDGIHASYVINELEEMTFTIIDSSGKEYLYVILNSAPIEFKDTNFKQALLQVADDNGDGQIYPEEAIGVENLYLSYKGITDISGIEYFKNLNYLRLDNNEIKSLLPLSKLYKSMEEPEYLSYSIYNNPLNTSTTLNAVHLSEYDIYSWGYLQDEIWEVPANDNVVVNNGSISIEITLNSNWPNKLTGITLPDGTYVSGPSATYLTDSYEGLNFIIHEETGKEYSYVIEDKSPIQFIDPLFKQYLLDEGVDKNNDNEITREEARQVTYLDINNSDISNINEIIYFTGLNGINITNTKIKELIALSKLVQSLDREIYPHIWNNTLVDSSTPNAIRVSQYDIINYWGEVEYEAWVVPAYSEAQDNIVTITLNKESAIDFTSVILPNGEEVISDTVVYELDENAGIVQFIIKDTEGNQYTVDIVTSAIVEFKDQELKRAILQSNVDKNDDGEISYQEAIQVSGLYLSGYFKDLSELKNFRNLKYLHLYTYGDDTGLDYSSIGTLTNLRELNLSNNNIKDISWISNLHLMYDLKLSGNKIEDFSYLANLSSLQTLDLTNTGINNLKVLKDIPNLSSVHLANNNLVDVSDLDLISNLSSLSLSYNKDLNLETLPKTDRITWLALEGLGIEDISFLSNYPNLESILLANNNIKDILPLVKLFDSNLRSTSLSQNPLNNSQTLGAIHLSDLSFGDWNNWYEVWVIPQNYITTQVVGQNVEVLFDSYLSVTDVTTDGQSLTINNNKVVLSPREETYILSISDKYGNNYESKVEHNATNTAPTIELIGDEFIEINQFETFTDPGAVAQDAEEENLPYEVIGKVDTTLPGTYELIYIVTDSQGETAQVSRVVKVNAAPTIALNGENIIELNMYDAYEELGAIANDLEEGQLEVTITGTVDTTKLGTYILTYTAVDYRGQLVTVERTIIVQPLAIDLNQDGIINQGDIDLLVPYYNMTSEDSQWRADYDLNEDVIIDLFDFVLITGSKYFTGEASLNLDDASSDSQEIIDEEIMEVSELLPSIDETHISEFEVSKEIISE